MPKIQANTLAEHRSMRREALLEAAISIALESGGDSVTMAEVAKRAGLSRSSVYEYFESSADLIADVILDELDIWARTLLQAVQSETDPALRIVAWIDCAFGYISAGQHRLARSLGAVSLPASRVPAVRQAHMRLVQPLIDALKGASVPEPTACAMYVNGAIDAATRRIDAGCDAELEIATTRVFVLSGIHGLSS
ncbi:MAG TPA: TetR/AcrR family transcriptional regulator [Candidatus Nanopelagicaceae bacterium]|nr:TetR/AcrR family transcriptional regulator [Candidatus Nanopelagicaceae bacterium]